MTTYAQNHTELFVYRHALAVAMEIFELSKSFPREEKYSLVDQIRRSSRSVCANITEAWKKRRYKAAFIAKLSDAETEAGETRNWIEIARGCRYLDDIKSQKIDAKIDHILRQISHMIDHADDWVIA